MPVTSSSVLSHDYIYIRHKLVWGTTINDPAIWRVSFFGHSPAPMEPASLEGTKPKRKERSRSRLAPLGATHDRIEGMNQVLRISSGLRHAMASRRTQQNIVVDTLYCL